MKPKILLLFFFFLRFAVAQVYLPASPGEIIHHTHYSLAYAEEHEQPYWVTYTLTKEQVNGTVSRSDQFRPDPAVSTESAQLADYKASGYDRGHICPAADMKISSQAMSESFFLSNMSPQNPSFNRGVWNKLEEYVRQIANTFHTIHVVTGPIFCDNLGTIGANHVTIPGYFYKVIYIPEPQTMLGFVIPNQPGKQKLYQYTLTIDSIETLTGIDFFPQLDTTLQASLEATIPNESAIISPASVQPEHALAHPFSNKSSSVSANACVGSNVIEAIPASQCLGIAKSTGQRCKSKTTNPNGYCNAHQSQVP
ncbi:endonuclease G [Breznakibacter xylanolyticus]|uniref:Endonuclease n=1 Tax=Breznakibacter xylanolyticus TaxID=990 RepID=A0A2W7NU25_9BACT|nr:DNA/RNA non-specific endonuclease [Breznakibacter xylanolyticus]PZX20104.1 endonuclease G [Breznakibacter xylanolyticus]